jgi:hypothetical protein
MKSFHHGKWANGGANFRVLVLHDQAQSAFQSHLTMTAQSHRLCISRALTWHPRSLNEKGSAFAPPLVVAIRWLICQCYLTDVRAAACTAFSTGCSVAKDEQFKLDVLLLTVTLV